VLRVQARVKDLAPADAYREAGFGKQAIQELLDHEKRVIDAKP